MYQSKINQKRFKTFAFLAFAAVFFLILTSCCDSQPNHCSVPQQFIVNSDPGKSGFDAKRLQRVDSLLEGYVRKGIAPNAVSFVARGGNIIHHKAYGYSDVEKKVPVKTTDIFRWASQTKAVTTAVVMTLFEEGIFMLDEPIEKYIPIFAHPQVYVSGNVLTGENLVTRPANRSVTVRQLLAHTSGYSYNFFGEDLNGFSYPHPTTTREVMERIARTPLMHDPGEKFTYGFGIDIAGYLAEAVTGKTLAVLMKERIFAPLGMNDSYFYLPEEKHDRLVKVYRESDAGFVNNPDGHEQYYPLATDRLYHGGGGGLVGTIEDYAKFCQMILNKGEFNNHRVLGRKTVEMMSVNHMIDVKEKYPYDFGLGFMIATQQNDFVKTMTSTGALRWGGAFGTTYTIDPKENMIILFYTNILGWSQYTPAPERFAISVYQSLKHE